MPQKLKLAVQNALAHLPKYSAAKLEQMIPLTEGGSGRKYSRLLLGGAKKDSLILLEYGYSLAPQFAGTSQFTQEDAYEELSPFLIQHGIQTPESYFHNRELHFFLVEDVGELMLGDLVRGEDPRHLDLVLEQFGDNWIETLFKDSIGIIAKYQAIPPTPSCVAFQRYLAFENYRSEIAEFTDFYGRERGISSAESNALGICFDAICETIGSFPKTLSHFDFMANNLFIGSEGQLRVLDFQDACLTSPARDIVSLLNDRGMDEVLGQELQRNLLAYYCETLKTADKFSFIYDMTLLHWDFRVSGRFIKLCRKYHTDFYMQWLPGTLRRLGRTLKRCYGSVHGLEDALEIVSKISPEVKEGSQDPWELWG